VTHDAAQIYHRDRWGIENANACGSASGIYLVVRACIGEAADCSKNRCTRSRGSPYPDASTGASVNVNPSGVMSGGARARAHFVGGRGESVSVSGRTIVGEAHQIVQLSTMPSSCPSFMWDMAASAFLLLCSAASRGVQ
jgi:hypothetical protein